MSDLAATNCGGCGDSSEYGKTVRSGEASVRTVKEYRGEGRLHE